MGYSMPWAGWPRIPVQPGRSRTDRQTTHILPEMAEVFEAITAARQPRSALNWLRNGAVASLLADVAAGRLAATHEALDAHPHRRAADYLRHILTAAGTLPPRDEELARTEQWLAGLLARADDPASRRLVQSFATWQVMRRLRRSTAASTRPHSPTAHARNQIKAAVGFLAWLASRGQSLASCRHADLDDWLATGPGAWQVRGFLTWAARRGHCRPFTIPGPGRAHGAATSPDQRWALAARLLHDSSLDPTDRVAGCLLLLYGQQLSRIAALTTGQVTRRDDAVFVRLGQHDVPVPGPLGAALHELIRNGRAHTGVGSPARTRWLFPGGMPGKPITASQLGERLRAMGIYAMPGRRAALTDLAAKMPASVLADCCTSHRAPRSDGCTKQEATGPATPPNSPGNAFTRPDECLRRRSRACTTRHDRNTAGYQYRRGGEPARTDGPHGP